MDILALLRGSPGAQAWMAQQGPALGALGISPREQLDREMSYDGSHPRQQEQEAINAFRGYGPQMLMDAFIPGYGAGGDAKAASEAYGEGRYGAAAGNALMAAMDFVPALGIVAGAPKAARKAKEMAAGIVDPSDSRLISSQRYIDEDIVSEKMGGDDFSVKVTPIFEYDGEKMRAIVDGHHRLEAARRKGVEPEFIEVDASSDDRVALLLSGQIEDYLEAARMDSDWRDFRTDRDLW